MPDLYADIVDMRRKFNLECPFRNPQLLTPEAQELRSALLNEEVDEYNAAVASGDLVEIFDALLDICVVSIGTAVEMGLPFREGWQEVMRSNMEKIRVDNPDETKRGSTMDLVKPKTWLAPQLENLITHPPWIDHASIQACCGGVGELGCACTRNQLRDQIYKLQVQVYDAGLNDASNKNILERANQIINERSEEKNRQYGDMDENLDHAAEIASIMQNKQFNGADIAVVLFALKLARHRRSYKQDSLLDAVAYLGALDNRIQKMGDERIEDN